MLSDPFTTQDGDVILRAGPEPGSKHDFRVHKVVLSLASHVFKDLFLTAQPDGSQADPLPVVAITDSPESVDLFLRFIYPGVVPPANPNLANLVALLTIADKYDVQTIPPAVKGLLANEEVQMDDPFGVYIIARRWGFDNEAKRAAQRVTLAEIRESPFSKDPQSMIGEDFLRLLWFMEKRGEETRRTIRTSLISACEKQIDPEFGEVSCRHTDEKAQEFFNGLAEEIIRRFDADPSSLDDGDLMAALWRAPDPPYTGFCKPEDEDYIRAMGVPPTYCPLRPQNIVSVLTSLVSILEGMSSKCWIKAMGEKFPS